MQVTKVTNFSAGHARGQNFNGHWEYKTMGASYPYEETNVNVNVYVADADESFDEIHRNFQARAKGQGPRRDIFEASNHSIYTIGGTNYFTDLSQNREAQKKYLTSSAESNIKNKKWVEAAQNKLKIAKILKEQGPKMERDKFLTEEGIRNIFYRAGGPEKKTIASMVKGYNVEMAKPLFAFLRKPI